MGLTKLWDSRKPQSLYNLVLFMQILSENAMDVNEMFMAGAKKPHKSEPHTVAIPTVLGCREFQAFILSEEAFIPTVLSPVPVSYVCNLFLRQALNETWLSWSSLCRRGWP